MAKTIDRRSFLKGALATGAAAGTISLMGCSSPSTAESAQSDSAAPDGAQAARSWEVVPDPISDDQISETVDVDVVVVGAGMSGMSAFMHAAEAGAKTVIIEKLDTYHGRGLDFAAIGTKIQNEAGIKINKGQLVNDLVKASGYKANGKLIKLWADHSGEVFDRLIDMTVADGGEVTLGSGSSASADAEDFATRTYPTDHMFGALVEGSMNLIGRMEKAGQEAGGESRYNTKAEQLITDDSGAVVGVIASNGDSYIKFNAAKGVILATGDYHNNPEMVAEWCPLIQNAEGSVYPEVDANTGDGINMALWAGGTIQLSDHAAMVHPIFGGGAMSTASYMKVNADGQRFCNENTSLPGISNMHMTNGGKVWAIFDSDYEEQMPKMSPLSAYNNNTAGPLTKYFSDGTMDPANPGSPTEVVNLCMEEGTTTEANSIEELAEAIGVPADALVATVDRYNELVDLGVDEDFGKDVADLQPIKKAPFYASQLTAKILCVASGLNVDSQMRVLNADNQPLGGLYAVGNVMGNFFANDYPICAPGLSHGRYLTLGALIGEAVATGTELA